MRVYFIGAGPGAQDLITVRGAEILKRVPFVMYAGSLVPPEVLCYCKPDAEIIDTSMLDLEQQEACEIAVWPPQIGDEARADRVGNVGKHDGNAAAFPLHRRSRPGRGR